MKYLTLLLATLTLLAGAYNAEAKLVKGYYKPSSGKYVAPHIRSKANHTKLDNYRR